MSELIDREATVKEICKIGKMLGTIDENVALVIAKLVQDDKSVFPTVEERPHGEWKKDSFFAICSECGLELQHYELVVSRLNFCPNCGADLRVKDELNRVSKELNSEIEKSKSEIVPDYRDGWRLKEGEEE